MEKEKILVCDFNFQWASGLCDYLSDLLFATIHVDSGREVQKELYENSEITTLFLNWSTKNHSALEVLRYVKTMKPSLRVFLTFDSDDEYQNSFLSENDLFRLGITAHFIKPFNNQKIGDTLKGGLKFDNWKDFQSNDTPRAPIEVYGEDHDFTRIDIENFANGARTVFDHYIKLGKNKYLKILNKGDSFHADTVSHFTKKDFHFLYFRSSERSEYINYLNTLLKKVVNKDNVSAEVKLNLTKAGSEMLIEEIYTHGLSPSLLKESKEMTEGIQNSLKGNSEIYDLIRKMQDEKPTQYAQSYLTSLFSGMICIQIPWAGKRTSEIVGQASFLLDIGMMKIPPSERNLKIEQMKFDELHRYHLHPSYSVEMLSRYNFVKDSVLQVIQDSHEYVNGEGFPKGLSGVQIYPLAKIVCFASEFADYILLNKLSPLEGIKTLLAKKVLLHCYDAEVVKCFVATLTERDYLTRVS